jgi:hypothetical protein
MRKRLESTDLAKNHWRANPSMTPSQTEQGQNQKLYL